MGMGSDVAKEAADLILLDSNFSSIVVGISNGRLVFDNLRKVVIFLLPSGNWAKMLPILAAVFLGLPLPLSAFYMIAISVATDTISSLSLIMEQPEGDLMEKPPAIKQGKKLIDWKLFALALGFLGNIEAFAAFFMYFLYMGWYAGIPPNRLFFAFEEYLTDGFEGFTREELLEHLFRAQTCYFITIVIMQVGNLFSTRTQFLSFFQHPPLFKKRSRNLYLFGAAFLAIVFAIFVVYITVFQDVFETREPPAPFWFLPIPFALGLFVLDEVRKAFLRCFARKKRSKRLGMLIRLPFFGTREFWTRKVISDKVVVIGERGESVAGVIHA